MRSKPKWLQSKPKEIHKKRVNSNTSNFGFDKLSLGGQEDVSHDNTIVLKRLIGRKAEKAKQKRQESDKEDVVVLMEKKT